MLKECPELIGLVPLLLDRGDPRGTELAIRLAAESQNAECLECLRVFALSQRGRDDLRIDAARICREAGLLPTRVQLWQEGKRKDLVILAFRLNWDEGEKLPKLARKLKDRGADALRAGRLAEAEALFRKGLAIAPESPGLANNLAAVYFQTGRESEALELTRRNHERHPDYPFSAITLASLAALDGDLDEAHRFLSPLLECKQMHVSEFASLCEVQLQIAEEQDPEAARFRPSRVR